jgi:hypothetical protein
MKQRNKCWLCVAAGVYAGQFIAATETKDELCGRIYEEKSNCFKVFYVNLK